MITPAYSPGEICSLKTRVNTAVYRYSPLRWDLQLSMRNGNESLSLLFFIEPVVERPDTELLFNTPDSTPGPSRMTVLQSRASTSAEGSTRPPDEPLINVVIRPHEGHSASKPLTIHPEQMVSQSPNIRLRVWEFERLNERKTWSFYMIYTF